MEIKLIITDFDGTLVDTFNANLKAYQKAFSEVGLELTEIQYRQCFGFRFEKFMEAMNVKDDDIAKQIRKLKGEYYPVFFHLLTTNQSLLDFIRKFRLGGGKTAVASTARRKNLENALTHIGALEDFDLVLAGEDVNKGKPDPEIYNTIMNSFGVVPGETLIFEDSEVGLKAANDSGANYIKIWNLK